MNVQITMIRLIYARSKKTICQERKHPKKMENLITQNKIKEERNLVRHRTA
jgi:hypothetical protein